MTAHRAALLYIATLREELETLRAALPSKATSTSAICSKLVPSAFKAAQFAELNDERIMQRFKDSALHDNTQKLVLGILSPITEMFSGMIGAISEGGAASGAIGGASSLLVLIANTANQGPQATQETQLMASGALDNNILNCWSDTSKTLLMVCNQYITNVSPARWVD